MAPQGSPSLSGEILFVRHQNQGVLARRVTERLDAGVNIGSPSAWRTSSAEHQGWREHIGEIEVSHTSAAATGHMRRGRPFHRGIVLHAWFDRIPRHGHLHPFSLDHASGPQTRARTLLTLGALEQVLGFPSVVVRDGIDHRAGPKFAEGVVTDRSAPDAAFFQLNVGNPATGAFGQHAPVAAVSSTPYMA